MAARLYKLDECAGRSQLPARLNAFGGEFLFLVRDVASARSIRSQQKSTLAAISGMQIIAEAVKDVNLGEILQNNSASSGELDGVGLESDAAADVNRDTASNEGIEVLRWPSDSIATCTLDALLRLYVGCQPLNDTELKQLLGAVAAYRKRTVVPNTPVLQRVVKLMRRLGMMPDGKDIYAQEIESILGEAVQRVSAPPEVLPLLVSAVVGGAEIFPLLLHWAVLRLSADPRAQEQLFAELVDQHSRPEKLSGAPSGGWTKTFVQAVAACACDCPVSAAIGAPRKLTKDLTFEGFTLPAECLVFAMHPGLRAADADDNVDEYADARAPYCTILPYQVTVHEPRSERAWSNLARPLRGNWLKRVGLSPLHVTGRYTQYNRAFLKEFNGTTWPLQFKPLGSWMMFGAGPRACPASEQSLNFLSALLAALVQEWRWELVDPLTMDVFTFTEDGSLFIPSKDTKLKFWRRPPVLSQ